MIDIVLRYVDGEGWLPIVKVGDSEVYRGEMKEDAITALYFCKDAISRLKKRIREDVLA